MELPYIRVVVLLHAAFAAVFLFLNRQHPSKFARLMAWSWSIEALRAATLLPGLHNFGGAPQFWYDLSAGLCLPANWCLLAGCASLVEVRLPGWLAPAYLGVSLPILLFDRFFLPGILHAIAGLPLERGSFYSVLQNLVLMFVPAAAFRVAILIWLVRTWRQTRLAGGLIAAIFCVPYAAFALVAPVQFYLTYNPEWIAVVWCVRVLGFSIGLVILLLDRQLAALRKSESSLATAQAGAKLGSWEVALGSGAPFWSAELFRLFDRDPAPGPPAFAGVLPCLHPEDRAAFARQFVEALPASPGHHGEYRLIRPDGSVRWLETRTILIRDAAGQPARLTGTMQDVTETKQLEEQFLRAQRVENLGLLAAGIAHDFNNILTPVLMVAPMLRERMTEQTDRNFLTTIEKSAERGAALVRQILAFVHGTGGSRLLVQSRHIVNDLASMITETFPRTIKLERRIATNPWPVLANPTQLHQILLNLCVNARDAMPAGGTLSLGLANCPLDPSAAAAIPDGRAGNFVLFEVGDTGRGIAPEVLPHIWEPFFTTKEQDKGTGLGLATVRGIVDSHDGFCLVATRVGAGTTFRVYLPAAEIGQPPENGSNPPFIPRGRGELILIVDDEANVRELTSATLANHGYRVLAAADGEEGLALVKSRAKDIALVLTDWHMPRLGGEALAAALRQLEPPPRLLVMSGLSSGGAGPSPQEAGDAYLPKPFKASALLTAVHRLLRSDPDRTN